MITQKRNTALMVFSLSATNEAERKPIFGSNRKHISSCFFKILIKRTASLAKASGVDVIWVDESVQKGHGFAERYTNAFKDLFDQGYENVVSIGNDCPELTLKTVKTAILELQEKKMVLGPSADGGVYLLGLNKTVFDPQRFQKLPWLGNTLFKALTKKADHRGIALHISEPLLDIDSAEDALTFTKNNPDSPVAEFVSLHFHLFNDPPTGYEQPYYFFSGRYNPSHRGPPYLG